MKLTNQTTPQARNYQCDECQGIFPHKGMNNEKYCYNCTDKKDSEDVK